MLFMNQNSYYRAISVLHTILIYLDLWYIALHYTIYF